jgi:site-specific recombinase XerD
MSGSNLGTAAVNPDYQFSHDLHHTCASRLIRNGMSLYEVSNILGHVDVQTTQRYAHLENVDVGWSQSERYY